MKPLLLFGAVLGVCAALGAPETRLHSGPARVALVELFTSEGCSSCPPADRWLAALRASPGLWRDFVPMAFHVDYWNRLGWPDRFATRAATQREYAYAAAWGAASVYTPCFVRDGDEWRGLRDFAPTGDAAGVLTATYDGRVLRAEFAPAEETGGGPFEIHAALLGGGIRSKVAAGENSGATLQHEFVVLTLVHGAAGESIALPRANVAGVSRYALAVWVTRRGGLAPLQAAGGWLE